MALYGMVIDLNKCNHCESCITACKVENNLQIVSKENADMGRVMQWMRLATSFYEGNYPDVRPVTMPALCLQCDDPPCTKVCPVRATYRSCLLYTSDAADEEDSVDLGGRRII